MIKVGQRVLVYVGVLVLSWLFGPLNLSHKTIAAQSREL